MSSSLGITKWWPLNKRTDTADTMQESKSLDRLYIPVSCQNKRRQTKNKRNADKKTNFEDVNQHPAKNCDEIWFKWERRAIKNNQSQALKTSTLSTQVVYSTLRWKAASYFRNTVHIPSIDHDRSKTPGECGIFQTFRQLHKKWCKMYMWISIQDFYGKNCIQQE